MDRILRLRLWVGSAVVLVILSAMWFAGIFSEPNNYDPIEPIDSNQVSQYLSNRLVPELHNKSQYGRPFDYVITQQGIVDIIARHADFARIANAGFESISVAFEKGAIFVTAKTERFGMDFFVTLSLKPVIDSDGMFLVKSQSVDVGSSSVPFAAMAVRKQLLDNLSSFVDHEKAAETVGAVIAKKAIEPIVKVNGRRIRIEKITIADKKITIRFAPINP